MEKTLIIGIADTTFARIDMAKMAIDEIGKKFPSLKVEFKRATVPGIKDLPVACLNLFERENCEIVIAIGMPGKMPIDKQCSHEASIGMQMAMLKAKRHIIEVFVHEEEGEDEADLFSLAQDRVRKHAVNAIYLARYPHELGKMAGKGLRQGREHAGPIEREKV